ncbi:MAG: hypothetical protein J6T65_03780 [Clostridia bacterium]|nr:hypothetical protein [Clostridia bacterium]
MFSNLFGKKIVDENKVTEFVSWFINNSERIQLSVENREKDRQEMLRVLDEVEAHLATVYRDGYKGRIEFDYGGKDDDWELNLYHMDKPFLINATQMIADKINSSEKCNWTVNTSH